MTNLRFAFAKHGRESAMANGSGQRVMIALRMLIWGTFWLLMIFFGLLIAAYALGLGRLMTPGNGFWMFLGSLVLAVLGTQLGRLPGTRDLRQSRPTPVAAPKATEFRAMGWYCPNCWAELGDQRAVPACWNCRAAFGPGSAWQPSASRNGTFRRFEQPVAVEAPVKPPAAPTPSAPEKKRRWYQPVTSREEALSMPRSASSVFFALAGLQACLSPLVGLNTLWDAALLAVCGYFVRRRHSRVAAILLLVETLGILAVTVANRMGPHPTGGSNAWLALIALWAGVRAVEATVKLHGRFAERVAQPVQG